MLAKKKTENYNKNKQTTIDIMICACIVYNIELKMN